MCFGMYVGPKLSWNRLQPFVFNWSVVCHWTYGTKITASLTSQYVLEIPCLCLLSIGIMGSGMTCFWGSESWSSALCSKALSSESSLQLFSSSHGAPFREDGGWVHCPFTFSTMQVLLANVLSFVIQGCLASAVSQQTVLALCSAHPEPAASQHSHVYSSATHCHHSKLDSS